MELDIIEFHREDYTESRDPPSPSSEIRWEGSGIRSIGAKSIGWLTVNIKLPVALEKVFIFLGIDVVI